MFLKKLFEKIFNYVLELKEQINDLIWQNGLLVDGLNKFDDRLTKIIESINKLDSDVLAMSKEVNKIHRNTNTEKLAAVNIDTKLSTIQNLVVETRPFKENEDVLVYEKFNELHDLNLPLSEVQEFQELENKLKDKNLTIADDLVRLAYFIFASIIIYFSFSLINY